MPLPTLEVSTAVDAFMQASDQSAMRAALALLSSPPQGRLTLTSNTPITVTDVTGATTLYYTPFVGRMVPIYNGTIFIPTDIGGQLSQATSDTTKSPAAVGNNLLYDIFAWNDSGTIRATRGPAWSSDTSRGTGAGTSEIEQVAGFWVNKVSITNGPAANRGTLVGTIRSNGSAQLVDTLATRWVSNAYNAVARPMKALEATANWAYNTSAWRQANNSTANQLDFVQCLAGLPIDARVVASYGCTVATFGVVGVGIDTVSGTTDLIGSFNNSAAGLIVDATTLYFGFPGIGRHYAAWLEYGGGLGTQTWYGTNGVGSLFQSGIIGTVWN